MTLAPDQATLQQLVGMLEALADPTRPDHRDAMVAVEENASNPVFVFHLMHVLGRMQHAVAPELRQLAGFIVKNQVFAQWELLDEQLQSVLQAEVLHALVDELPEIRNVAGSAVVMIVRHSSPQLWHGMVEQMLQLLDSDNIALVESCTTTLLKLCEDYPKAFDSLAAAQVVIPRLFDLFHHPAPHVRALAVKSLNALLAGNHDVVLVRCDNLLNGLAALSGDAVPEVRVAVWEALITLMMCDLSLMISSLGSLCVFMISSLADGNPDVGMQACDFWVVLCDAIEVDETDMVAAQVREYIPAIVQHLADRMVYTEEQLTQQRADDAAEAAGEKALSLRPMHLRRNAEEDSEPTVWTLRNFASSALDKTSTAHGSAVVLPALLPVLQEKLNSNSVWVQEAALLAFGAASSGCYADMGQYLPDLLPLLQSFLSNPVPEVRRIACWCFSRYAMYFIQNEQWFEQLLRLTLQLLLDDVPIVQEAACSTLLSLFSPEVEALPNYLVPILESAQAAFAKYGYKNFFNLCDVLATLADAVGQALANEQYVNMFVPIIVDRFQHTPDGDMSLIPLLECLTSITQAVGIEYQNYAIYTFQRAIKLLRETLLANALDEHGESDDTPPKDFIVVSLDVLSGMAQGFGPSFNMLVEDGDALLGLLSECARDESAVVRQSAFALLGELAQSWPQLVLANLNHLMLQLQENLNVRHETTCSNVCWAIGEIALKAGGDMMAPYVDSLMRLMGDVLCTDNLEPVLAQNIAITIGRLGVVCPQPVSQFLDDLLVPWCHALTLVEHPTEKENAFRGLVVTLHANLAAVEQDDGISYFALACSSWAGYHIQDNETVHELGNLLQTVKQRHAGPWRVMWATMSSETQNALNTLFGV